MVTETNFFRIEGLEALSTTYHLYQIAGLHRDSSEYYANVQGIVRYLSFKMRAPVTTFDMEGASFLAVPAAFGEPPDQVHLVRTVALLKHSGKEIEFDFTSVCPRLDSIRMRYLQFMLQNPLWRDSRLWQPGTGEPFFFKRPERRYGNTDLFEGFAMRVAPNPEGGFGLIVDLRRKLVSNSPLPLSPSRQQINALKGRSCLYKMGNQWFEISLDGLADIRAGEPSIPLNEKVVSLNDYLTINSSKPIPASISNLSPDGSVIYYRTNGPAQKSAPTALCHLVEDTHSREGAMHHRKTPIEPHERHRKVNRIVDKILKRISVGDVVLSVSAQAERADTKPFEPPNLRFGSDTILSVGRINHDACAAIGQYGRNRLTLLRKEGIGFFEKSPLDRQYFIMPQSVVSSYGPQFLKDLQRAVEDLYREEGGYSPEIIPFDDVNRPRDFVGQSRAIMEAVEGFRVNPGFAIVMVHRFDRRPRSADQLAAWTVKEFPIQFNLNAAVIHTEVAAKAYVSKGHGNDTSYRVKVSERGRLSGYLRNVALNKILLTNGKWPFILDSPLHADVVIGIDVKNNTAAFTLIANGGKIIRLSMSSSRQKEQLLKAQVEKYILEIFHKDASYFSERPRQIAIHRDGHVWPSEIEGLKEACQQLSKEELIDPDWRLSVVEIVKSAKAPLRLFEVKRSENGQKPYVQNPLVGTWAQTGPSEGFVCTTGRPFRISGTAHPLRVKRASGSMSIKRCLSDVFSLSCLTWTRPEGATRLPLSLILCNRSLFDEASNYDRDAIDFANDHFEKEMEL